MIKYISNIVDSTKVDVEDYEIFSNVYVLTKENKFFEVATAEALFKHENCVGWCVNFTVNIYNVCISFFVDYVHIEVDDHCDFFFVRSASLRNYNKLIEFFKKEFAAEKRFVRLFENAKRLDKIYEKIFEYDKAITVFARGL